MSENYLYVSGLEHRVTELEELLREAQTLLHWGFFANFKDDNASKALQAKIDKILGEDDEK